jgi:hypothetical protein
MLSETYTPACSSEFLTHWVLNATSLVRLPPLLWRLLRLGATAANWPCSRAYLRIRENIREQRSARQTKRTSELI